MQIPQADPAPQGVETPTPQGDGRLARAHGARIDTTPQGVETPTPLGDS